MKTKLIEVLKTFIGDVGTNNESNRQGWLVQTLQKIPAGYRILDAGAGTQQFKYLCAHLVYVSQDFGKYDGKGNNAGLHTGDFDYKEIDIVSDITDIPEPEKSFDAIMCTEVLEHLPSPALAIKEFARLLREDGHLIITAPFCSLTHFAPYHYATGFSRYFYEYHLAKHGFQIIEIKANGSYFDYLAQEIRRLDSIANKYANSGLNILEKTFVVFLLLALRRLNEEDNGSDELLCFGYHIHAKKVKSMNI